MNNELKDKYKEKIEKIISEHITIEDAGIYYTQNELKEDIESLLNEVYEQALEDLYWVLFKEYMILKASDEFADGFNACIGKVVEYKKKDTNQDEQKD